MPDPFATPYPKRRERRAEIKRRKEMWEKFQTTAREVWLHLENAVTANNISSLMWKTWLDDVRRQPITVNVKHYTIILRVDRTIECPRVKATDLMLMAAEPDTAYDDLPNFHENDVYEFNRKITQALYNDFTAFANL